MKFEVVGRLKRLYNDHTLLFKLVENERVLLSRNDTFDLRVIATVIAKKQNFQNNNLCKASIIVYLDLTLRKNPFKASKPYLMSQTIVIYTHTSYIVVFRYIQLIILD